MTETSPNKLRTLRVMDILMEKTDEDNPITPQEIMDILYRDYDIESDRKSIYRDLNVLQEYGLDILKTRDTATRYYIGERNFELAELKLLVDAVQSSRFITQKKSRELIKKIEKLSSDFDAGKLARQVYVSNRIKTMNESIYYAVDNLHSAIYQNRKISFKYYQWNLKGEKELRHGGKTYVMSPWALAWVEDNYYLVAFDSEEAIIRHFRVDKMLDIRILDDKREGKDEFKNFDLGEYTGKTFGMFGGTDYNVSLRCANELSGVIIDRFGNDSFLRPCEDEPGWFDVIVKVSLSPTFLSWTMTFGDRMRITGPPQVREKAREMATQILEMYK